jgi:hypothetical protein
VGVSDLNTRPKKPFSDQFIQEHGNNKNVRVSCLDCLLLHLLVELLFRGLDQRLGVS